MVEEASASRWRKELAAWLETRLDLDTVQVTDVAAADHGYSAQTRAVEVRHGAGGGSGPCRVLVRTEQPHRAIYPPQVADDIHDIELQYRVMAALAEDGTVPVAPMVGYEPDAAVLGAPFFVMGFVEGQVPGESPPYTTEGFFLSASPEQRRQMIGDGVRVLRDLHRVDWRAAGLEWLVGDAATPGTARQLALWRAHAERELAGRSHPLLEQAFARLEAEPIDDPQVGLCWGDPRPGNMIWREHACVCAMDFEGAHIGVPEQDLGWWLMFDRTMHPDGTRPEGDPTRAQQRAEYERLLGRTLVAPAFHELFAAARYAVIVTRVTNGWVESGRLPADHTVWLENPATACLGEVLAEWDAA